MKVESNWSAVVLKPENKADFTLIERLIAAIEKGGTKVDRTGSGKDDDIWLSKKGELIFPTGQ